MREALTPRLALSFPAPSNLGREMGKGVCLSLTWEN